MPPTLSRICLYPIKSLDPVEVTAVSIGKQSLVHDREFALVTAADGEVLNGKRTGRVNQLRADYDLDAFTVSLGARADWRPETFHLLHDVERLEAYVSRFFGEPVELIHDQEGQLLDIPAESSVTVVARETLELLASAIPGHTIDDIRLRFRSNLEISGVPPFWEEKLVTAGREGVRFDVGEASLVGISIRARCNVPPRDPGTGVLDKRFVKAMVAARERTVPDWSPVRELGSLYHLTINTFAPDSERGKRVRVGDPVVIRDRVDLDRLG